ncbi:aldolase, partial [Streptomyces sp. DSM 41636]|nr:aldolase [Streptomyces sp. DSM 41636]
GVAVAQPDLSHAGAVGVGSPLVGDAADGGSLTALRARAHAFTTAVREAAR